MKIMQREMELIANKEGSWGTGDDENINVRGSTVTREVTATYLKVSKEAWVSCLLLSEARLRIFLPHAVSRLWCSVAK